MIENPFFGAVVAFSALVWVARVGAAHDRRAGDVCVLPSQWRSRHRIGAIADRRSGDGAAACNATPNSRAAYEVTEIASQPGWSKRVARMRAR